MSDLYKLTFDCLIDIEKLAIRRQDEALMTECTECWKQLPCQEDYHAVSAWSNQVCDMELNRT